MNPRVRDEVRTRADRRCEYCRIPDEFFEVSFHIDHIRPRKHKGDDEFDNLAWACPACSLFKGYAISGFDEKGELVRLFHPRKDTWTDHFKWEGPLISSQSEVGAATIEVLKMNIDYRVEARQELMEERVFF